jgi:hypothetical protein
VSTSEPLLIPDRCRGNPLRQAQDLQRGVGLETMFTSEVGKPTSGSRTRLADNRVERPGFVTEPNQLVTFFGMSVQGDTREEFALCCQRGYT